MLFSGIDSLDEVLNHDAQYDQLCSVVKNIPGAVFLVDFMHRYVAMNPEGERIVGMQALYAIGKTIRDMPFRGSELSGEYGKYDHKAYTGKTSKILSYHYCGKNNESLELSIGSISPIYNTDEKVVGVWCHGIVMPSLFLKNMEIFIQTSSKYYPKKQDQFVVDLDQAYDDLELPPRQAEVFFFLLRGKTSKEIAEILNLSCRTVESYTEDLKNKLNCSTKSELIEKGIVAGYLGILPETLFYQFQRR